MANDLTLRNQPSSMPELPQWLVSSVSTMSMDYPPKIPANMALTAARRAEVSSLADDCRRSLTPATKREIAGTVMRLLADYPVDGASAAAEDARNRNWIEALEGLPAWAIDAARLKWLRNEVEGVNPDFAPKPPRFREIILGCMKPVFERKAKLTLLLRAEPEVEGNLSDEKRAELAALLTGLSAELKSKSTEGHIRPQQAV